MDCQFTPIFEVNRKLCFDVEGGKIAKGSRIILYRHHGDKNQLWHYDGTYIRSAANEDMVIDISGCKIQNGTKIQLWKINYGKAQQFDFTDGVFRCRADPKFVISAGRANGKDRVPLKLHEYGIKGDSIVQAFDHDSFGGADGAHKVCFVRLETSSQFLHVQEVDVYDTHGVIQSLEKNGAKARQSSQGWNGDASFPINGNRCIKQLWPNSNHTQNGPLEYWEVRLPRPTSVQRVVVYNRPDGCQKRLCGATLHLLDESRMHAAPQRRLGAQRKQEFWFASEKHRCPAVKKECTKPEQCAGPQKTIHVSDGNVKEIQVDGTFIVNGEKHGQGRWISSTRFVCQVANWGNIWWIGDLTEEGMKTTCVKHEHLCEGARPEHKEKWWKKEVGKSQKQHKFEKKCGDSNEEFFAIRLENYADSVVDICGGRIKNGSSIILWPYHGGNNQLWTYDGTYIRSKANPNYVIDIYYGNFKPGTQLHLWHFNGTPAQHWDFDGKRFRSRKDPTLVMEVRKIGTHKKLCLGVLGSSSVQHWLGPKPPSYEDIVDENEKIPIMEDLFDRLPKNQNYARIKMRFYEEEVDVEILTQLDDEVLQELGATKKIWRLKIQNAVRAILEEYELKDEGQEEKCTGTCV